MGANRLPIIADASVRRRPAAGSGGGTSSGPERAGPLGRVMRTWRSAPLLGDVLSPDRNSFGVLRLMLALAVLISHAVFLRTGSFAAEPLVGLTGYSLGQYAVQGFFVLSGILVTQSLVNRGDLFDYGRARAFRIFPALIACVLITALIVGPALSTLGVAAYFGSLDVPKYIAKTLSLSTGSATLPGVFANSPADGAVNQSLWTLKYEVACYLLLGAIAALIWRMKARRTVTAAALAVWAALTLILNPNLHHAGDFFDTLTYFMLFFGTGVTAYLLRGSIRLSWLPLPVLAIVFAMLWRTDLAEISSAAFLGYGMVWLATYTFGALRAYTATNDYSYGVYIYSYPVTQAILMVHPGIPVLQLIGWTLALTLVLAYLSWELVERPALDAVHRWRAQGSHGQAPQPQPEQATPTGPPEAPHAAGAELPSSVAETPPQNAGPAEIETRGEWRVPPPRPFVQKPPAPVPLDKSRLKARLAKIAEEARHRPPV